jgi:hypothetical protein
MSDPKPCTRPPAGWRCTRGEHDDGPCAAVPDDRSVRFRPGLYRHYKGGLYTAICLVTHHETRKSMVLYVSHTYGGINVRPLVGWDDGRGQYDAGASGCTDTDGWLDRVAIPESVSSVAGVHTTRYVNRFEFIGELPSDIKINERVTERTFPAPTYYEVWTVGDCLDDPGLCLDDDGTQMVFTVERAAQIAAERLARTRPGKFTVKPVQR